MPPSGGSAWHHPRPVRPLRALPAALVGLALLAPAGAGAAATFGAASLTASPQPGGACPGGAPSCTTVLAAPATRAPADGVVVSWTVRAAPGDLAVTLRAVRPDADGRYAAVATDATTRTIHGGAPETFAARLPMRRGDALALTAAQIPDARDPAAAGALAVLGAPFPDGGAARAADAAPAGGLLLQAGFEPDADGDGYGDDTQDACPAEAARHAGPCAAQLSVATAGAPRYAVVGGAVEHVFRVADAGPGAAPDVVVTLGASAGARVLEARTTAGTCTVGAEATCAVGTLASGADALVTLVVSTDVPGDVATTAEVASGALDADPADDAAQAVTRFTPPSVAPPATVFPTPACANVRTGTNDDEVLDGTAFGDRLVGRGGRDLLRGHEAGDCLEGGLGRDVLAGGTGDDRLSGGTGADRLLGDEGADRLEGGAGDDVLAGGTGNDVLLPGTGVDRVVAGAGDDAVSARDRTRDVIDCGPGRDTARVDRRDRVRNCESVSRG